MISREKQMERISANLRKKSEEGYYGEVAIKMEAGNIVHLKYTQSEKIENLEEVSPNAEASGGSS